jgi:signal recognition particle receptor subunit beta
MKENEGTFVWKTSHSGFDKPQHTVDIPGHGRLSWRLKDFVGVAKAIVIVVDSTAIGNVAYCR